MRSREYPGPFAGRVNPPPTSMDLALLDAELDRIPYTRLYGYLYYLQRHHAKKESLP